ncbi:protein HEXIM1-like isoform X2 [Paramacrobiotus metropolitanus]|uniref:protein HEXIM1-like isoform X2 n=1 Tax=Paramacrobiotus metropolitanus TaxID=2943436 RepID=UPI0024460154|nr:protein HEXIM1-like isoform X2 [Paramacrobiotus metropolitanus]
MDDISGGGTGVPHNADSYINAQRTAGAHRKQNSEIVSSATSDSSAPTPNTMIASPASHVDAAASRPEMTSIGRGRFRRNVVGHRGSADRKGKYRSRKAANPRLNNNADADRRPTPSDGSDQSERGVQKFPKTFNNRKRFQRQRKDHKWKPYHLLTWEEKKALDERETIRAEQRRNQLTTLGFPQAPYNTTQFLMEDHKSEYDKQFDDETAGLSSEESSPGDADIDSLPALDRGYDQEYMRVLTANLNALSKERLITYVLQMEQEKGVLERQVRLLQKEVDDLTPKLDGTESSDVDAKEERRLAVPSDDGSDATVDFPATHNMEIGWLLFNHSQNRATIL